MARHDAINRFRSETYYRLNGIICVKTETGDEEIQLNLRWLRNRLFDKDAATALLRTVQENRNQVHVVSNQSKECVKNPPLPLNTVAMLKLASRVLGISPKDTMRIAEDLYLRGLISYPRTETSKYPRHFDIKACIRM